MRSRVVCAALIFAANTFAQGVGTIFGIVTDPSGLGVPAAKVEATLVERGMAHTVITDAQGGYVLPSMPIGTYSITVEATGFIPFNGPSISLTADQNVRVDAKLDIRAERAGKVVMEDGSPPPEPVTIYASYCGGAGAHPVSKTDSKGNFGGIGSTVDMARSRPMSSEGSFCELQARLDGYRSDPVKVDVFADGPTLVLHPILGVEGLTTSLTSLAAPKNAREAFWKAQEAIEKKQWDEARPQLEKAVKIYPKYALAWFCLGWVHQNSGDVAQARSAYERAVQADRKFIKPYLELTKIYNKERNWRAMADMTAAVIKLDPFSYPATYVYNAESNFRLGNLEAAEASAREAIRLDGRHVYPEAEYTLGVILGTRGDYKGAAEHLRNYLLLAPNSPNAETVRKQLARAEELAAAKPAGEQVTPKSP